MNERSYTPVDSILDLLDQGLRTVFATPPPSQRDDPAGSVPEGDLTDTQRRLAGGLMRVNHTGEICAQALYSGQAATSRNPELRAQLLAAAREETEHLSWCQGRLDAMDTHTSYFNPLWYTGSFLLGAAAGIAGDDWSLGFVVETERQVEAHLEGHLDRLPEADEKSRAVVRQMKEDEARHGRDAQEAGARELPEPVRRVMGVCADVMRFVAYRV
ncbi:MAG: 2-polyprenyl-3-methyl-6-methoxy-1,4-benzoquinone monooxygenase [Gammaproteobacteria bacterium]|nr:MAG: 2-polyprenyl-3-methyl-6-methoxy-1,4-benzoquinone monooxygenase [Gammaproteobacteria bacterium]